MTQCNSITKNGSRCSRTALPGSRFCWQHESNFIKRLSLGGLTTIILAVIGLAADLTGLGLPFPLFSKPSATVPPIQPTITAPTSTPIPTPPRIPIGKFGVVVAGFGFRQGEATIVESALADEVSNAIYATISEMAEIDVVKDWSTPGVGRVLGSSTIKREEQVAEIAELLGADVVIYGVVSRDELFTSIEPEFFIASTFASLEPELTGSIQFGEPVTFVHDSDDQVLTAITSLQRRLSDLRIFFRGLSSYYAGDFPLAIELFGQVIKSDETNVNALRILAGNAAARSNDFYRAMSYYEDALLHTPDYGRALIGKGNVYFQLSVESLGGRTPLDLCSSQESSSDVNVELTETESFKFDWNTSGDSRMSCFAPFTKEERDPQYLAQLAIDCYKQAESTAELPDNFDIDAKAAFGLSQVYLWLSMGGLPLWDEAESQMQRLISLYDHSPYLAQQERIQIMTAHAYAWLGLVTQNLNENPTENLRVSLTYYENAVKLLETDINQQYSQCSLDIYRQNIAYLRALLGPQSGQTNPKATKQK